MGSLKFFDAFMKTAPTTPKQGYKEETQAIFTNFMENAPNIFYDVEMESAYGNADFQKITAGVRVDGVVTFNTGLHDADNWKVFIFYPDFETPELGRKFRWKGSDWIVTSTSNLESQVISVEVRRCNNVLRWIDDYGKYIEEPCVMDVVLRFTKNDNTSIVTTGHNEQKIWCQKNERTNKIKANQRFLFGTKDNRVCVKLYGGGTKNFMNTLTYDDNSPSVTEFYLENYQINYELDDLEKGIANAYANNFSISITNISNQYIVGATSQLKAEIKKNDMIINSEVIWKTSNNKIAEISDSGMLILLSAGKVNISACMADNNEIISINEIEVVTNPTVDSYEIVILPNDKYLLEKSTQTYTCNLYKNGELQLDNFVFTNITTKVPRTNYIFSIIDGNNFTIENKKMYLESPVTIKCTSGENIKNYSVTLKGIF